MGVRNGFVAEKPSPRIKNRGLLPDTLHYYPRHLNRPVLTIPYPPDEAERLQALLAYDIVDTPPEASLDRITRLASAHFDIPVAAVTLVTEDEQFFKSCVGADVDGTSREVAFCTHTIMQPGVLVVEDATQDPRFQENPLVTGEFGIRFYAGAPLITPAGHALGSLCLIDTQPRTFDAEDQAVLQEFAALVVDELELRRTTREMAERKQAAKAAETKVTRVLESIGEGFISIDADDNLQYVNEVARRMLGLRDAAVEGKNVWAVLPDLVSTRFATSFTRCKQERERQTVESRRPGSDQLLEVDLYPTDEGGATVYFRDVTEERRTQERLRASEQRLRAAEQMAAVGHWELDLRTGNVHCSDGVMTMLGLNESKVHIDALFGMVHTDDAEQVEPGFRAAIANEAAYDDTFRFVARSGEILYLHVRSHVKETAHGEPKLFGITRNITAEVRAQQAAEANEQRLAGILNSAMDAIVTVDDAHRIVLFNKAAERMFGYTAEEMRGKPMSTLIPEQFHAQHGPRVEAFGKTNETTRRMGQLGSVFGQRRTGEEFPAEASISSVQTSEGHLYTVILRDVTEQREAQEALAETKERFDLAIQGGHLGIFDWRPGTDYMTWNEEGAALLGLDLDRVDHSVDTWVERVHPEDVPEVMALNRQLLSGAAEAGEALHRIRHADGTYRWINAHSQVVSFDDAGKAERIVGVFQDVTEQVESRRELEESEARYRSVVESIREVIFELDADGHWAYVNPAWESLLGFTPEETVGQHFLDFVHPDDRAVCIDRFERVVQEECRTCQAEVRYCCANGSTRWFEVNAWMVTGDDGGPKGISGTLYDLTERRAAEDALRHAKEIADQLVEKRTAELRRTNQQLQQMATLVDHAGDAIFIQDAEGTITYWNQSAEALYGWPWEEAIGANIHTLLYGARDTMHAQVQARAQEHGAWAGEMIHRTRGDERVHVESRWSRAEAHVPGAQDAFLVVNTDITERKNLERQVRRAQRMESLGKLAGSVAHDVNNVLGPILMSLEMLESVATDDRSQRLIQALASGAERGAGLMRQLLSFARGSEGVPEVMPLGPVLDELHDIVRETIPPTIDLAFHYPSDLHHVKGDATQLHQVVMNLAVNAIDAMDDEGTLQIHAENVVLDADVPTHLEALPGRYVRITVADTGTGIPPDMQEKIFDPFYTTKGNGTGLGLSTTLGIVRGHQGFIDMESTEGVGTTFSVYLPVADAEAQAPTAEAAPVPDGEGQRILLVDDEVGLRMVTQRVLETHGYIVHAAGNGAEAARILRQRGGDIALVVTDVMMPVMDGPALVDLLSDLNPDLPVIAVSGLVTKESVVADEAAQVKAFLAKPYRANTLLRTVHEVLSRAQAPDPVAP